MKKDEPVSNEGNFPTPITSLNEEKAKIVARKATMINPLRAINKSDSLFTYLAGTQP
jgi:hypothetical protein